MCGTRGQRGVLHVWHTWLTRGQQVWPMALLVPLAFFSRIQASELRIRIRFWITNRDSLTHDEDYKTLQKG